MAVHQPVAVPIVRGLEAVGKVRVGTVRAAVAVAMGVGLAMEGCSVEGCLAAEARLAVVRVATVAATMAAHLAAVAWEEAMEGTMAVVDDPAVVQMAACRAAVLVAMEAARPARAEVVKVAVAAVEGVGEVVAAARAAGTSQWRGIVGQGHQG